VDDREPYWIYGGLQDNGSWAFPSRSRSPLGVTNDDAFKIGEGDGFLCEVDPNDRNTVYYESQNGGIARADLLTSSSRRVSRPRGEGGQGQQNVRFNWETPFKLSPFNSQILYFAGHRLMRSVNRGQSSQFLSDELTRTGSGAATALAVSPREEGLIYVGTEEGSLWITRDEGRTWTDLSERIPLLSTFRWVSHIAASEFEASVAYVVLDGHRIGDKRPAVFRTRDYGETFEDLSAGLPMVSTRVIKEDPRSKDLLYVGHEVGVSVSLDGGTNWIPLGSGLPVVPVHDIQVHGRDREIILGTHGRGAWILNAVPYQELSGKPLPKAPQLLVHDRAISWRSDGSRNQFGDQGFQSKSPPNGIDIAYWLPEVPTGKDSMELLVHDRNGVLVRTLNPTKDLGLNLIRWDFTRDNEGRSRSRRSVPPGDYVLTLSVKGSAPDRARIQVVADPLMDQEGDAR
jgi:hypothetical protein